MRGVGGFSFSTHSPLFFIFPVTLCPVFICQVLANLYVSTFLTFIYLFIYLLLLFIFSFCYFSSLMYLGRSSRYYEGMVVGLASLDAFSLLDLL
jgi:hypothetical protein